MVYTGYVKGNFKKYIFRSDNGYVVGLFKVKDSDIFLECIDKVITFTGYFHELNENDIYNFTGEFVFHDRYGEQFNVSEYSIVLPTDKDNVISFLSSSLFPGIGEKKAKIIVDTLGEDVLTKVSSDSSVLDNVKSLTSKQKNTIITSLEKYEASFKTVLNLTKLGFTMKQALGIYNLYKDKTMDIISSNPYIISQNLKEISFKMIDKLRSNFNILENDINRIKASVLYAMDYYSFLTGNTYMSLDEIILSVKKLIYFSEEEVIKEAVSNLLNDALIINYEDSYYLYDLYIAEEEIADRLYYLANTLKTKKIDEDLISNFETKVGIKYNDLQKKAIAKALENNLLVITGGPGTGKTTIIKAICELYKDMNKLSLSDLLNELYLLAPTGRASKRISEQANLPAYTIHRFLKWNKEDNSFRVNMENKSKARVVIVDEASMIDTSLFYNLLLGLRRDCKIILIGDYNQLPSVGCGQVLKDIIESNVIDVVNLKKLYRQEETSKINILAHNISNNLECDSLFNETDDLTFVECNSSNLKDYLKDFILTYKDVDLNDIQVMAPVYKGDNGIDELNFFLQDILNPKKSGTKEVRIEGINYRINDKVLQLVNMPDDNIYNGDIGYIENFDKTKVSINFDGNYVTFDKVSDISIKLGYTISIHKSQGSEFDIVILPILNIYSNMLYKKLIYTAVTRAKKKLIILGEKTAFNKAIHNNKDRSRKTNLKKFLELCIK